MSGRSFTHLRQLTFVALAVVTLFGAAPTDAAAAPPKGGTATLAMIAEPQSLDPMTTTADLTATIMQHVYESLYTFDAAWDIRPMLAEKLPKISKDGLTVEIPLRKGVKFHNGREMKSDDVVASLKRWMEVAPRGKALAKNGATVDAKGPYVVVYKLTQPVPSLLAHLAMPSGFAAIMAKETLANPLKEYIGTGPYKFKERKPDQYVVLVRNDAYSARSEAGSGYAGKRVALLDELHFVPVPNANTRVEGSLSGQYDFADVLPVEAYSRLDNQPKVEPLLTKPFGFPYLVLNTKAGPLVKKELRQAVQEALNETEMMTAGFGDPKFFSIEGNHYPKGSLYYSTAGVEHYNTADPKKAAAMATAAGYNGTPIRILTSKQYEFHYRIALVMAENLKKAGFKTDMQVVDWATLVQRRGDPALWDIYTTHSPFLPEPTLTPPQLGDDAPGWWKSPAKDAALKAFNGESDLKKRGPLWGKVQAVVYDEVPYIKVANFNGLTARSKRLEGYTPMPWPSFWNTGIRK
ncbi:MAG TPA: ABC transporter substrate-binding protein [Polyangia bacterium]|jgi:peptide/nickel transport system substrate-binding protein